jgi:hypothetical protein
MRFVFNKDLKTTELEGEMPLLVHYGNDKYNKFLFRKIENIDFVKPNGGLWTSPIDSKYGWRHFIANNSEYSDFLEKRFFLSLKKTAKVLVINCYEDFIQLPVVISNKFYESLDFELITEYYDAIWVTMKGLAETAHHRRNSRKGPIMPPNLWGWDVETVLLLNKDAIA